MSADTSNVHRLYFKGLLPLHKPSEATQFPSVIAHLETLLERARAGRVSSIAYVAIDMESGRIDYNAQGVAVAPGGTASTFALMGALGRLHNQLERKCDEPLDHEDD